MKFLVLDTETGGIDPSNTSLLQIYLAVYDEQFNDVDNMELKIKPDNNQYKVTAEALGVNKINLIEHSKIAVSEKEAKLALFNFLAENSKAGKEKLTVVGWNIHFDLGFIYEQLLPKSEWEKSVSYRTLDLQPVGAMLKLAGKLPNTLGSLGSYAEHFGFDTSGAHDAKEDVKLTLNVFKKFKELI